MNRVNVPGDPLDLPAGRGSGSPLVDRMDAFLGGLGRRGKVVMSQLPLSVTVALVVAATAVFHPESLADVGFQAAWRSHAALFGLSVAVPWNRLPAGAYAVIPVLDCMAIGFTRETGGSNFNVVSLLLVFPVTWLAVDRNRAGVVLAAAAALLSTLLPAAALGNVPNQASMIRTIFLPLVMAAIALTAHVVAGTLYRQRETLVRIGEPIEAGSKVAVEWWTTMREGENEITLPGCLVLRFAEDGRCKELREYWHVEHRRIDPPEGWGR